MAQEMKTSFLQSWENFKAQEIALTKQCKEMLVKMAENNVSFKKSIFIYDNDGYSYEVESIEMISGEVYLNCLDDMQLDLDDISWDTMIGLVKTYCEEN